MSNSVSGSLLSRQYRGSPRRSICSFISVQGINARSHHQFSWRLSSSYKIFSPRNDIPIS